jgi:hypothetical protein
MKIKIPTTEDYGFVCLKIDDSVEISKLLNSAETMAKDKPYSQVCVFNSFNQRTNSMNVPVLHLNQAKFFYGNLFLFDVQSAIITRSFPNLYKRYYYARDIPWEKNSLGNYKEWKEIFNHDNIEIIAQNKHIFDIYEICWKKPIMIAEDFTYENIKKVLV